MKITYLTTSRFLAPCESALVLHGGDLTAGIEIPLDAGGYQEIVTVTVDADDAIYFETNWENTDPSRFPARIKAGATALFNRGYAGTFLVAHQDRTGYSSYNAMRAGAASNSKPRWRPTARCFNRSRRDTKS